MSSGEIFGYIASALVFATFYMRTMLPLRVVALASNVAFITYALIDGLTPILILHGALLPLNLLRLLQIREFTAQVERAATQEFSAQAILPFMSKRVVRAKDILFSANELADELYYVVEGELFLPEVQRTVSSGSFLGEFALFSETGRRTATAIAVTDCTIMALTKKAVFAALLQHPTLGIHLLKLVTVRMLQNAGVSDRHLMPVDGASPGKDASVLSPRFLDRFGRKSRIALVTVLAAIPIVAAVYQPIYVVLDRDAAVTSWLNVATAPIAGTVEGFETRAGQKVDVTGVVARIVNHSSDRSAVIRAEGQERRAEARLTQIGHYNERVLQLSKEWADRKARYAEGFRRDLDLEIQDLEQRLALQSERVKLADASAQRRRALRVSGTASQADEDLATASHREVQVTLTQMTKALERVRERRRLAGTGVFIQQDGKEPEWSWRSIDEIDLEAARAKRAVVDAQEELSTARSIFDQERKNLEASTTVSVRVAAGMTIWSTAVTNNASVTQGEKLFSWIDCNTLLVDVPVTETLAALLYEGMRANVSLEGDPQVRKATVLFTRGASSRLGGSDLASVSRGHKLGTAQVLVVLVDSRNISGCPIGRRAYVGFPDVRLLQYISAYVPGL
ncbi:cyclic nucleotide-binding domain-containing protein [Reyranella sp.]|uniref:cyclic nucleotide-binding domain-containing protein n=1 Tax=Reyranella sp. TaxID=1929291 RepID=UPI0012207685|nr:cyclic nucleotide-binding domain-containing protein [Reyranella sp.]TAJ85220.1 MAG: cyclic nucleotide-binding domain-containing protein [Reyranella sp.]